MKDKMKILIAYDGSECAHAALADLQRAGLPPQAEAHVLAVYAEWLPPSVSYGLTQPEIPEYLLPEKRAALARARLARTALKLSFPDWKIEVEACLGSPASEILRRADEMKPDLIVVGSHGRSAIGRFFLGSVSQKVLHAAHCTVRIARGHAAELDAPIRLLIGVDGSAGAAAAVRTVAERHWPPGTEVRIVNTPLMLPPATANTEVPSIVELLAAENARVEQVIEAAVEKLRVAGLAVSTIVKKEDVRHLLISEAEAWQADCIFLGARGSGLLRRFLLGSVASAVAARAHCSVEVFREEE